MEGAVFSGKLCTEVGHALDLQLFVQYTAWHLSKQHRQSRF